MIQGVIFLLAAAYLCFCLHVFGEDIMHFIVSSDTIFDATMDYLYWRVFGFFFSFINVMFRAFYIGVTKTKVLTINAIVMVYECGLRLCIDIRKLRIPRNGHSGRSYRIGHSRGLIYSILPDLHLCDC